MRKTVSVSALSIFCAALFLSLSVAIGSAEAATAGARHGHAHSHGATSSTAPTSAFADTAAAAKTAVDSAKVKTSADSLKATAVKSDSIKADSVKNAQADSLKNAEKAKLVADSLKADSAKAAQAAAVAAADTSLGADSTGADSTKAKAKKRKRIVRETTVNTIDELKGKYRSPKKALFMSLIVPGLGQAYVGQHWSNYARGAFYFLTDVTLATAWHYYVVDRQNEEISSYKKFADANWKQVLYEDKIQAQYAGNTDGKAEARNPHRDSYCESVQSRETNEGAKLFAGCSDPHSANWQSFRDEYNDADSSAEAIGRRRDQFVNSHNFYEIIGKEEEFITGWVDANTGNNSVVIGDSAFYQGDKDGNPIKVDGKLVLATTDKQQQYIAMRAKANDYARMQAYFLGGMVLNHIVSALDAALSAHYHNKELYQTEVRWWDKIRMDSQLAWDGFRPKPTVTAYLTF